MPKLGNLLLLLVSVVLSILTGEFLARIVLDPVDYVLPRLIDDDFLFFRIEGHTGGHDAWGFRNAQTPKSADIVSIGDSFTYGLAAQARDSWPTVLGRISGKTVYNMGVPGYGPIQYLYLMRTKAVILHPKTVIIGFYVGNDLMDVYNEVRFNKNWSAYGNLGGSDVKPPTFAFQHPSGKFLGSLRDWMAKRSLVYALLTRTSMFDFARERELETAMANNPGGLIAYHDDKHSVIFNLSEAANHLFDIEDLRIKSAMEITKQVMLDMRRMSEKHTFRLIVALIPTKQSVYAKPLAQSSYLNKYPRLAEAIHQEDVAREAISSLLHQSNIEVIDLLPRLEAAAADYDPYARTDLHANADGYRVMAETVNDYLDGHH